MRPAMWSSGPESIVKELLEHVDEDISITFGRGARVHCVLRAVYRDGLVLENKNGDTLLVPLTAVETIERAEPR